jgi:8-oxo-dGTP diphosphatase
MLNTSLCYIDNGTQYLMLHRIKKAHDVNHGKWIGLGGKMKEESPDECMIREVREESGLEVTQWLYRGVLTFIAPPWESEIIHLFTASETRGSLRECNEGALQWVDKRELQNLNLWQGDRIFLRFLLAGEPFFSLKLVYDGDTLQQAVKNGVSLPLPDAFQQPF